MPDQAAELLAALENGLIDRRTVLGVTVRGKTDGGGAQLQAVMSGRLFGEVSGVPYLHTPLTTVAHGTADATWAAAWDDAFGLGSGVPAVPEDARVVDIPTLLADPGGGPAVVASTAFHSVADKMPERYVPLVPAFRAAAGVPQERRVRRRRPTVAVHVRRGDVGRRSVRRFTPDEDVARTIAGLRAALPDARIVVHSEGEKADFAWAQAELSLDADPIETVRALIDADVLVTAKSSFSYVAAMLTHGVVLYQPFWHPPLPHWLVVAEGGDLDRAALRRALGRRRLWPLP